MGHDDHELEAMLQSPREMFAGGVAGLSEHICTFPFDTIKTRMQADPARFGSVRSVVLHILRDEHPTHFFRGCAPIVTSAFPAHAAYFGVYEAAKRWLGADGSMGYAVASTAAIAAHDAVSVPFDVVKQHMQIDGHRAHTSSLACMRCIVQERGASALLKSYPTTVLMNVPHAMTHWVVYEALRKRLVIDDDEELTIHSMAAGFVAGGAAATSSTPLDVLRTKIQLGHATGAAEAARLVLAERGPLGFFTGLTPRVCFMAPSAAVVMATYEVTKRLVGA